MSILEKTSLVPSNFLTRVGSNNYALLLIDSEVDAISSPFLLQSDIVELLSNPPDPSGFVNYRMDTIGNSLGLAREGFSNATYAKLIRLFRYQQDSVEINNIESLLVLLSDDGFISSTWSVSTGVYEGAILKGDRKLTGTEKLLGGVYNANGDFLPNTSSIGEAIIRVSLSDDTTQKRGILERLIRRNTPVGIIIKIEYA